MRSDVRILIVLGAVVWTAACAAKAPPPIPVALKFPEFLYPSVPGTARPAEAASIDRGWRYLQNESLKQASREFQVPLKRNPLFHPALTGQAYVALAGRDHRAALASFDAALAREPGYVPALVGRGQTLLALDREAEAIAAFEAALAIDASLAAVRQRVDVLRFRALEDLVERARTAAGAGQLEDGRAAFQQAIQISPDTAFLHQELASVERRRGDAQAALAGFRRAVSLDQSDGASWVAIGELLDQQGDYAGAEAAFRAAIELDPTDELRRRLERVRERARDAKLPPEFHAIAGTPQITRGDLAALIGVGFEELLRRAPSKQVVTTDTRGHWASSWIAVVANAGVIEPFANHTFQPETRIRRVDLATAVHRLLMLATANRPQLRSEWVKNPPKVPDVGKGHLDYTAVSTAVASGAIPLIDGRFQVARTVSGAEAAEALNRVRAIAAIEK